MKAKIIFAICLCISIALLIGGFFAPPMGEINSSVLTGVGELWAFAALAAGARAIDEGLSTKIKHGNTEIEISQDDENE